MTECSKTTPFRVWLNAKWIEYTDERNEFRLPQEFSSPAEYFRHYRWWLKRQYKQEKQPQYEAL